VDIDTFLETFAERDLKLSVSVAEDLPGRTPETMDALFHLPLLALAAMIIARRTPFPTFSLGRKVAMLLIEHFAALRGANHVLETSITLRRRCADALAFLEAANLVSISGDHKRNVSLTDAGKKHVDAAARDASDLGLLVRQLRTSQERLKARIGDDG
jgi:hypothetical protein